MNRMNSTRTRIAALIALAITAGATATGFAAPLGEPIAPAGNGVFREDGEITVNSVAITVNRYRWPDSQGLTRSVSLVPASGSNAGYAVQMSYMVSDGPGVYHTVYVNADPSGDGGFGYFVSHELFRHFDDGSPDGFDGTIAALHGQDDSPFGRYLPSTGSSSSVGRPQAFHEYRLNYPRWGTVATIDDPSVTPVDPALAAHQFFSLPVIIRWTFMAGRDYPLWSVDYDLSAASDHISTDVRGPYGVMQFNEGTATGVSALKWGDKYLFSADAGFADLGNVARTPGAQSWSWNVVNNGRRYNALGSGTYELGIVDTVPRAASKYGDGYANNRNSVSSVAASCDYGMQSLPCDWEWAYQSFQYDYGPPARPKIGWGSAPFLGSSLPASYITSTEAEPLSGLGHISYTVRIVFGRSGAGAPLSTALAAAPFEPAATVTTAFSPRGTGSVSYTVLGDPGGPYSGAPRTLAPWSSVAATATPAAGYVFAGWDISGTESCSTDAGCSYPCYGQWTPCSAAITGDRILRARFKTPGTVLYSTPGWLDFGAQRSGSTSAAKTINLVPGGTSARLYNFQFVFSDPARFAQTNDCTTIGVILATYKSCNVQVTFTPTGAASGPVEASLTITSTADFGPNDPLVIDLSGMAVSVAVADFNADARSDILWRNGSTGQVYRMLMNGFTTANGAIAYTEPDTAWKIVADADFNGDGVSDLLWRNATTGQIYYMPFSASGMPSAGSIFYTEANPAWKIIQTPDLDGDGKADILWYNTSTGQVYAMLMNGGAIVAQNSVYTEPSLDWSIAAAGDFAGSGKRNQLLWRNSVTGGVFLMSVSYATGAFGTTGQMIYTEPNTAWKIIGAADFNGDGKTDILWRNDSTGQVYAMLLNGASIASQGMVYTEPNAAWKIVANGDYDGDGKSDLLWRNDATGQVYMMLMNGLAIAAQQMVYTEPNTAWKILGPREYAQ